MAQISNKDQFVSTYEAALYECVRNNPELYGYSVDQIPTVMARAKKAILNLTFDHAGLAFKLTCRKLGINCSRKDIFEYLRGG